PLSTLYAGIFADWDIQNASFNKADYDAVNRMGYVYSTQASPVYCGIKLLTPSGIIVNSMDNLGGGAGGIDITDGFTTAEKYQSLTVNRAQAGNSGANGNDVAQVVSAGPFNMAPDDSVVVVFALIAGDNLADIQNSAVAAQQKYDSLYAVGIRALPAANNGLEIFPNPAKDYVSVVFTQLSNEHPLISLMNIEGEVVRTFPVAESTKGEKMRSQLSLSNMARGMYLLTFQSQFRSLTQKLVITK
ncbi:MAG: T9SS type A sorting domain-containing protein, partial [Bacteroidota bacterium]